MTLPPAEAPVSTIQRRRVVPRTDRRPVLLAAYGATVAALLYLVARPALADDTYITMGYARTLAFHGQWGMAEGLTANTATSPLNVWILAAATFLTRSPGVAVALVLALALTLTAVWMSRIAGTWVAVAGVALLVGAPVLNSAVGLEVYLAAAVLVGAVHYADRGSLVPVAVLCGLSVLVRPDLAVATGVAVLVLVPWRRWPLVAAVAAGVAVPWHAFTWWAFGSALPDTFAAKWALFQGAPGVGEAVPLLWEWFTYATAISLATIGAGVLALAVGWERRDRPAVALGVAGATHLLVITVAGNGPAFYYAAPGVTGLGLCAVLVGLRPVVEHRRGVRPAALPTFVVLAIVAAGLVLAVGRGVPWSDGTAPMRVNWATPQQYQAAAAALPPGVVESAGEGTLRNVGEIGTLAYFAPPGTRVVEFLSDPGRAALLIAEYRAAHPWMEWNFRHYEAPAPLPAQWRLVASADAPSGPGTWPMTSKDAPRSLALLPAP